MSKIESVLYGDGKGLFFRLRDGNYAISEEEKQIIVEFSKQMNEKLKSNQLNSEEVIIAFDLLYSLKEFKRQEWTAYLANEVYDNLLNGIDFCD